MAVFEIVLELLAAWFPDWAFSEETKGREVLLSLGLVGAMETCAAAFSSFLLALAGLTLPWIIVSVIHHHAMALEDIDPRHDLHRKIFYSALTVVAGVCVIDQTAHMLVLQVHGTLWTRETITIGASLAAQAAVVAAFPVLLTVLWYLPNRMLACGAAAIIGGVMSYVIDQVFWEHVVAYVRFAALPPLSLADVAIVLGVALSLVGTFLPRAQPASFRAVDLRQS